MGWKGEEAEYSGKSKFLDDYIHGGKLLQRAQPASRLFPSRDELCQYDLSTRKTSHPRDFILAIIPQYGFYKVPTTARVMGFGELFLDCFQQGERVGWNFVPMD
jgi:hypothetical protein